MKRQHFEDAGQATQAGPKRLASSNFLDTVLNNNIGNDFYQHDSYGRQGGLRGCERHDIVPVISDDSDGDIEIQDASPHHLANHSSNLSDGYGEPQSSSGLESPLPPTDCEYFCYGVIEEINAQTLRSANSYDFRQVPRCPTDNRFVKLSLDIGTERCIVCDAAGFPLLLINSKMSAALKELKDSTEVHIETFAPYEEWSKLFGQSQNYHQKRRSIRLHANFYGLETKSSEVGVILSKHQAYLQIPHHTRHGSVYQNPHVIEFEGVSESDIWLQQLQSMMQSSASSTSVDWSSVLDDLPQYLGSGESADTTLMESKLFNHQLVAQNYMSRRETGQLEHDMKFWQLESSDQGVPIHRHVVTGNETYEDPAEPKSGILADHMGLGKTLSSISLIAGSMERAADFANAPASVLLNGSTLLANTKGTLVVVPSVLLMEEWEKEIAKHTKPNALNVTRYHGQARPKHFAALQAFDIVLTTYGTITKEFSKLHTQAREVLYYLRWFRIVLDEAHTIRSRRTKQFDAAFHLQAQYHWCLTGTPVSNRIEDLEALLQFCRVPLLQEHDCFRSNVTKVAKRSLPQACRILRQTLSPICLRRTKALLDIPEPRAIEYVLDLSEIEKKMYRKLEAYYRNMINASVSRKGAAYNVMFKAILQLRIFCDQGAYYEMPEDEEDGMDAAEALTLLEQRGEAMCVRCSAEVSTINQPEEPNAGSIGTCGHILCHVCLEVGRQRHSERGHHHCPACDQDVVERRYVHARAPINFDVGLDKVKCTKMERLLEDLLQSQWREKSIVFSVWTRTLDIAAEMCRRNGIVHVRVDGRVPQQERTLALERFSKHRSEDGSVPVLLMTLGTGALGLNLTAGSRIHILEPQWNPAVEDQAIGRAIRIGQEKEATIIRYLMRNSVEQQIQSYQRRKRNLAAGGFGDAFKHADGDSASFNGDVSED